MLLRIIPVLINIIMYFVFNLENTLHYFYYTVPFLFFGKWYLLVLGIYYYIQHSSAAIWIIITAIVWMIYDYVKGDDSAVETAATKQERKSDRTNRGNYSSQNRNKKNSKQNEYDWEEEKKQNQYQSDNQSYSKKEDDEYRRRKEDDEYWERKRKEDDAYFYRKNGGPRWKIDEADDALGRSKIDRDYEDEHYERRCNECREPESQCKCCSKCDRYPCECCDERGYADCRCCSRCDRYPC